MEWEKEGAESWALPHYGPSRTTNPRGEGEYEADPEDKNNPVSYDKYAYISCSSSMPSTTNSIPPTNGLFSAPSAVSKSSDYVLKHVNKQSAPLGLRGDQTQSSRQCSTQRSFASNQNIAGHGKLPGQSTGGFGPGKYGVPKKRHAFLTSHQPQKLDRHKGITSRSLRSLSSSHNESFAKSKWRKGAAADASFRLPCEYRAFKEKLAQTADVCDEINQQTGAYVRVSGRSAKQIEIWGKESQVLAAQKKIQGLVDKTAQPKRLEEPHNWDKIHAHSKIQVASENFKEHCDVKIEELCKAPRIPTDCMFIFLWPQYGPSLSHCLVSRRQNLDDLRKLYDVNIYTKPGIEDCLFFSGDNEQNLCRISNELREMWQALFVQYETEIKLFLVEPPTISIMQSKVILEKLGDLSKAFLYGIKLPRDRVASWTSAAQGFKQENKNNIKDHLDRALQLIPHFDGFLQMRANFGTFMLEEWRKPVTGNTYSFEEFRNMLRLQNVRGRLLPGIRLPQEEMLERIMTAKGLLVPWGAERLSSLMKIKPKHSANFEYQVRGDSIIRVEVEFSVPPGSGEFETNGIRCFKPRKIGTQGDLKMPMQIGMIDFERSDWQFEVKALALCQENDYTIELNKFTRSIKYNWNSSVKSIGSEPMRKANFSPGAPVTRFVEKSAIQLKVIGTPYVFELSRFDEYVRMNRQWPKSPKVTWGGSLFNPEWDDILGAQAKLNLAETQNDRCLSAFFPASPEAIRDAKKGMDQEEADEKHEDICRQKEIEELKNFMSKIQTIARLMGSPDFEMVDVLETDVGILF